MWQAIYNFNHRDFDVNEKNLWITRINYLLRRPMNDVMVTDDLKEGLIDDGGSNVQVNFVYDALVMVNVDGMEFLCKNE